MRFTFAFLGVLVALAACSDPLAPVNDARKAVQQHFGDDWNITLPIVNGAGKDAIVCGYTERPDEPGSSPPLSDERLFIYAGGQLVLPEDMGNQAFSDRVDKDCRGLLRIRVVQPRMIDALPSG